MMMNLLSLMRSRRVRGVFFRCRPYLAFMAVCGGGLALILWTQTHVLHPRFSARLETPTGSKRGAPCLLSRLYDIDCAKLFAANVTYLQEMAARKEWQESGHCVQEPLEQLVRDCRSLQQRHGYHRWPVTPQENDFPLAFGLKIHHAPEMFERLLRVLWRPHNFYCVHVDSKTPLEIYQLVQDVTDCFDNVVMAEVRVDLVYLSITSLLSDVECMRKAVNSTVPWKYYLNLSGQEFPLKTNLEIVQILSLLNGKNDVESYLPTHYVSSWFNFHHIIVNGSVYQTKVKKEPFRYPIPIRKGSAYGAFSHEFLDFALKSQLAREFIVWLVDTMAPDELFWATLNHLPGTPGGVRHPVSHRYGTVLSRAVVWEWDKYKCRSYVRGVCIFTASDLPWLGSRPELIANKFDQLVDPIALDCLEVALEERTLLAFREAMFSPLDGPQRVGSLNWTFYRSLPHMKSV